MCRSVLVALDSGRYDSVVVLVGNIHGIKSIAWAPEVSHNLQYLAGRLIQEGVKVFTVMQYWGEETEQPRLISTTTPQGEVLAMKVMDPVNHGVNMIGGDAADAVVLWPKLYKLRGLTEVQVRFCEVGVKFTRATRLGRRKTSPYPIS
jgi:hypothetical protein